QGSRRLSSAPAGLFRCRDGYISISAFEPHQYDGLLRVMRDPAWARDPRFSRATTTSERAQHADALKANMEAWLADHDQAEVFAACQAARVPATPVYTTAGVLRDAHLRARGYFVPVDFPEAGRLEVPGPPYDFGAIPRLLKQRPIPPSPGCASPSSAG